MRFLPLRFAVAIYAVTVCSNLVAEAVPGAASQVGERVATESGLRELEVVYVANEGFLVEGAGKRVLVDALFSGGAPGYVNAPDELRRRLEGGIEPWDRVDVALASHYHRDHFDAQAVGRFLESNPEAIFVSTPQAIQRLREAHGAETPWLDRARSVLPPEGEVVVLEIGGVAIEVLNLHHGRLEPPVENLGFVVHLGSQSFLHFGDTEAKHDDFAPYLQRLEATDVALLPFWFLSSEWRAEMVRREIRPRHIVVGHLPEEGAPAGHFARWRSYRNLVETIRTAFPQALFPGAPGGPVELPTER